MLRALSLAVIVLPATAWAQPRGSIYDVQPAIDGIAAAAMLAVAGLIDLEKDRWAGLSPCTREGRIPTEAELEAYEKLKDVEGLCDHEGVMGFELFVVNQQSQFAQTASDILLLTMAAAPYAFSLADVYVADVEKPGLRFGEESLVAAQAQTATILGVSLLKVIVKRPRPLTHSERWSKADRFGGDARLSFPSGHAALSFASASLIAFGAFARHGAKAPGSWVAGSVAYLTAGFVAYLRVAGGKHFVTDVLAGAAVGIAAGLLVPTLHKRSDVVMPDDGSDQMMLSIGGVF